MYYHFLRKDECLRYSPYTKVEVGQTLTCEGPLDLCYNGLHASRRVLDALRYAPGPILCEVELGGELLEEEDKVCARSRTVLSMRDISPILNEFAYRVTEKVLNTLDIYEWEAPPPKRKWFLTTRLRQKAVAGISDLHAARKAAWLAGDTFIFDPASKAAVWLAAQGNGFSINDLPNAQLVAMGADRALGCVWVDRKLEEELFFSAGYSQNELLMEMLQYA